MSPVSSPEVPPGSPVDVLVATYQSAATLDGALTAIRANVPVHCLLVVDRPGTDGSAEIARRHGARVISEDVGLGAARNRALAAADTEPVLFVDSDVRITGPEFYSAARREFARPGTAAVVGMSVGHRFRYGLPLGLTLIGRSWSLSAGIPDRAQGRETYYLQRAVRSQHLHVRYVADAMVHDGTYRRDPTWPEFQGASIRAASGWNPRELVYAGVVVLLMHLNSRRVRNLLYSPIFYGKLLRGFLAPQRWARLDRGVTRARPVAAGPGP
jgi:glycosyltransferase involved in cell wall biosynthesis